MKNEKLIKLNSGEATIQKIYQYGKQVIKVKREFATEGPTVSEQAVSMLIDMMDNKKER